MVSFILFIFIFELNIQLLQGYQKIYNYYNDLARGCSVCFFFFQKQLVSAFWLLVLLCPCLNMGSVVSSELQYVLCALVYCSSILRLKYFLYQSVQAIFWFKAVLIIINCFFVCQCCSAPVYSSTSSTSTHLKKLDNGHLFLFPGS